MRVHGSFHFLAKKALINFLAMRSDAHLTWSMQTGRSSVSCSCAPILSFHELARRGHAGHDCIRTDYSHSHSHLHTRACPPTRHVTAPTHTPSCKTLISLMHSSLSLDQLTDMPSRCAIAWPRCLGRCQHFKNVEKRCTRRSPREPPCTSAQRPTHRHHGRECFWGLDRDGVDTTAKGGRPVSGATCLHVLESAAAAIHSHAHTGADALEHATMVTPPSCARMHVRASAPTYTSTATTFFLQSLLRTPTHARSLTLQHNCTFDHSL
jgi:hypothetical protein